MSGTNKPIYVKWPESVEVATTNAAAGVIVVTADSDTPETKLY